MTTGIYQLNFDDGSIYIGQALNIEKRFYEHLTQLNNATHTVKMQEAFLRSNRALPTIKILIECHRDYLDIFECFLIHDADRSRLVNSSIPADICAGMTQSTMNLLVENRRNSIVQLLDVLDTYKIRVNGLKMSLAEAEDEIDTLSHKRSVEEIKAVAKTKFTTKIKELEEKLTSNEFHYAELKIEKERIEKELAEYKAKSFWQRLFG